MLWFASVFGQTTLAVVLFVVYNLLPVIILVGVFYAAVYLNMMRPATILNDFYANLSSGFRNNSWAVVVILMLVYWVGIAYFAGHGKPPESPLPKAVSGAVAAGKDWVLRGSDGEMQDSVSELIDYDLRAVEPAPAPEPEKKYPSWWWWLQPVIGFPLSLALLALIFSDDAIGLGALMITFFARRGGAVSSTPDPAGTGTSSTSGSGRQYAPGIMGQIQRLFYWIGDDVAGDLIARQIANWFGRRFS